MECIRVAAGHLHNLATRTIDAKRSWRSATSRLRHQPGEPGGDHEARAKAALTERGVDVERIVKGGRVKFVEAGMSRPDFGVAPELYKEVRSVNPGVGPR